MLMYHGTGIQIVDIEVLKAYKWDIMKVLLLCSRRDVKVLRAFYCMDIRILSQKLNATGVACCSVSWSWHSLWVCVQVWVVTLSDRYLWGVKWRVICSGSAFGACAVMFLKIFFSCHRILPIESYWKLLWRARQRPWPPSVRAQKGKF